MDLTTTRTIDITKMALDGLMMRQKAIVANTANVLSPDYTRKEVDFESQLKQMVEKDDLKTAIKVQNSLNYNPTSLDSAVSFDSQPNKLTAQQAKYLQTNVYDGYAPQITDDTLSAVGENGNNVDIEKEIMDMAKVGTKYNVLANLEQRSFKEISDVIKGTGQ